MPQLADHIDCAAVQLDLRIPTASADHIDYAALQLELLDLRIPT